MKEKMFFIKTILIYSFIVFIAYMLMNVQPDSPIDISEVESRLDSEGDLGTMKKTDTMMIKRVFGLNSAEFEGSVYYKGEGAMDVTELLIIKLKSDNQSEFVKAAIRERLDSQIQNFTNYGTNQLQLLESSEIQVIGNYCFYAVSENAVQLKEIFVNSI